MDVSKIPLNVLTDIRARGFPDSEIARMSARDAFEQYCEWNGLNKWSDYLFTAVETLKAADS